MGFELVDAAIALLAEVTVEGFAGFAGGFGLSFRGGMGVSDVLLVPGDVGKGEGREGGK